MLQVNSNSSAMSSCSNALSGSTPALVLDSIEGKKGAGLDLHAPASGGLSKDSDLNVKAAPFVPSSAPTTPNLNLTSILPADEVRTHPLCYGLIAA